MKLRLTLAVVLAHLLVLPAAAQDRNQGRHDRPSYRPNLISGEMLFDEDVRDQSGDELGEIEGLILDPQHREIAYVVLETEDDFLFFGDEVKKAVPWSALSFTRDDEGEVIVVLNAARSKLDDAVVFTGDEVVGDAMFIRDVYAAFGDEYEREYRRYYGDQERPGDWRRPANRQLEKIIDTDVFSRDRNELGEIEDVVVEASGGQILYAIVDLDGDVRDGLGMVRDEVAVPWRALDTTAEDFSLAMDARDLQKLVYNWDAEGVEGLEDPEFARHLHRVAQVRPYWQEERMQQRFAEATERQRERWDTGYGTARESRSGAAGYHDVGTVSGTVERVMTRAFGAMDEMVLKLRTDAGEVVYARMGPEWFADQQDFDVRAGDEVTVTGMQLQREGRPEIYIVREARTADASIRVRDDQFRPEWSDRRYGGR